MVFLTRNWKYKQVIWSFDRDWEYAGDCEIWIERAFVLRVTCDACEGWMIPTTHAAVDLPEETLKVLQKKYKRHVNPSEVDEILKLIPQAGMRLYAGAALGQARVIRFSGQFSNAFAWSGTTAILERNDYLNLEKDAEGQTSGKENREFGKRPYVIRIGFSST